MLAGSENNPDHFAVAVILQKQAVEGNPWLDNRWNALGITVQSQLKDSISSRLIKQTATYSHYLWTGLTINLYVDQAESYYHNLMTQTPRLFVVCRMNNQDEPEPFLVTASSDEANSYVEVDDLAYSVDFPVEFYAWIEAFVLTHYVPEKKKKRKLKNWRVSE